MSKLNKFFIGYSKFEARSGRGKQIFATISDWVSFEKTAIYTTALTLLLPKFNIPTNAYVILILVVLWQIVRRALLYFIGRWDEIKLGFWKKQNEYQSKTEHLSPYNYELRETLKEVCKKFNIEHKFKEI